MNTGISKQNATATAKKTTETQRNLSKTTLDNLSTALHGEAFAYVKYLLYAERARKGVLYSVIRHADSTVLVVPRRNEAATCTT